jgi:hypothetical protein
MSNRSNQLQNLENRTEATVCPHLPQLITYWAEQTDGTRTPSEPIVSDWQREHFPYNPMHDASLQCSCGRERLEFQIVSVHNWLDVAA